VWTGGQPVEVYLMTAVLRYSRRLYCRAFLAQRQDDWLECQSRLGGEPFSRAKVSQLSSRGIRIDYRNADACVVAKVEGSLVQGHAPESYPQIELVSLGSAFEAPKEPSRQINREAARIGSLRGVQWACAAKLLSTA